MKNNKQDIYIIYSYDAFKNDYNYIREYTSIKELQEKEQDTFKLKNKKSIYHYIKENIDADAINLLNNKYIIIKDTM